MTYVYDVDKDDLRVVDNLYEQKVPLNDSKNRTEVLFYFKPNI